MSANSFGAYDSQPNTPESTGSAEDTQHERPRRRLRELELAGLDLDAIRVLWGDEERGERLCHKCRGGIELVRRAGAWVDKQHDCLRCKRHRIIFMRHWPNKPALDPALPPYQTFEAALAAKKAAARAVADPDRALRRQWKADKRMFARSHPTKAEQFRGEVRDKRARAYEIEEFELERIGVVGNVPSSFKRFSEEVRTAVPLLVLWATPLADSPTTGSRRSRSGM